MLFRSGRSGRAWVLLVGRETDYVEFMAVRKIPLKEQPCFGGDGSPVSEEDEDDDPEITSIMSTIRQKVLADRALHDKVLLEALHYQDAVDYGLQAAKAFVSFVRAYSKHEASYIFRVKDLDFVGLARSFGLLRLPRMPELKDVPKDGWVDADVNVRAFIVIDFSEN